MSWGRLFETGHTRSLRDTVTSVVSGDCRTATSTSVAITLRYQFYVYRDTQVFRCPFFMRWRDRGNCVPVAGPTVSAMLSPAVAIASGG